MEIVKKTDLQILYPEIVYFITNPYTLDLVHKWEENKLHKPLELRGFQNTYDGSLWQIIYKPYFVESMNYGGIFLFQQLDFIDDLLPIEKHKKYYKGDLFHKYAALLNLPCYIYSTYGKKFKYYLLEDNLNVIIRSLYKYEKQNTLTTDKDWEVFKNQYDIKNDR